MTLPPKLPISKFNAFFVIVNSIVILCSAAEIIISRNHNSYAAGELMSAILVSSILIFLACIQYDSFRSGEIRLGRVSAYLIIIRKNSPIIFWFMFLFLTGIWMVLLAVDCRIFSEFTIKLTLN
jgi:hypothetical protein